MGHRDSMHGNSLKAFAESDFNPRERSVMRVCREAGIALTDRAIMRALGFADPNKVRPRVTHLVEIGALVESGDVECPETGKTVRTVKPGKPVQGSLW